MAVEHNIDLDELLDGSWMEKARSRARIRLIDSIQSKEGVEVVGGDLFTEEGRIVEAFSFYYARLVVCASEDERLIARWAQAEAARAEQVLIRDHKNLGLIARTYIANIQQAEHENAPLSSESVCQLWWGSAAASDALSRALCGRLGSAISSRSVRKLPGLDGGCQIVMFTRVG